MLESEHLELQENNQEPVTRSKIKRMILEYLQKRNPKEILEEITCEKDFNYLD